MSRMNGMRTGFMLGSMIGLFAGMFLASKNGHKVRDNIEKTYSDTKRQVKDFVNDASENVTETWENIQERMYSTVEGNMNNITQAKPQMEIGEIGKIAHKIASKADKGKTDALMHAFLTAEAKKAKKGQRNED